MYYVHLANNVYVAAQKRIIGYKKTGIRFLIHSNEETDMAYIVKGKVLYGNTKLERGGRSSQNVTGRV
jgi:hypothetical protein